MNPDKMRDRRIRLVCRLASNRHKLYANCRSENGFWLAESSNAGLSAPNEDPHVELEVVMDTNSPDARALIWTGLSMAAILVAAALAYAVFL